MSKKIKNLGPSNDAIPEAEMILAKIVQSAKARGMGVVYGPKYWGNVKPLLPLRLHDDLDRMDKHQPHMAPRCCAYGAADLDGDVEIFNLARGHEGWTTIPSDYNDPGYQAGAAFADAMGGRAVVRR